MEITYRYQNVQFLCNKTILSSRINDNNNNQIFDFKDFNNDISISYGLILIVLSNESASI